MSDAPPTSPDRSFDLFAGACAVALGVGGVVYGVTFLVLLRDGGRPTAGANAAFLLLGGVLSTAVLVALYRRLRETSPALALWGLLLGVVAAMGTAIHGGFDLANAVNPPETPRGDLPNFIDPRGLLTFGISAIAIFAIAWLMVRGGRFPRRLGYLGYALAVLLLLIYLGRLIILDPNNPALLGGAALAAFLVNPVWYVWVGLELRREGGAG